MAAIGVPQRDFLCPLAEGRQQGRPACTAPGCPHPWQHGPGPGSPLGTAAPGTCRESCLTRSGQWFPPPGRSRSCGAHSGLPTSPLTGFLHPQVIFLGLPSLPRAAWHSGDGQPGTCAARSREGALVPAHPLGHFFFLIGILLQGGGCSTPPPMCDSAMCWARGCCCHCGYQSLGTSRWVPAAGYESLGASRPRSQSKCFITSIKHLPPVPPAAPSPSHRRGGGSCSLSLWHISSARRPQAPGNPG